MRDKELQDSTEFKTISFVHHAGFIGGAFDRDEAVKMAELSIKEHEEGEKKE